MRWSMTSARPFLFSLSLLITILLHVRFATSQDCSISPLVLPWSNTTVTGNSLGVSRGIPFTLGDPPQILAFRPSFAFNNTRVNNVLSCGTSVAIAEANNSCVGSLGGVYNLEESSTYRASIKGLWNGSQVDEITEHVTFGYFNDRVGFQGAGDVWGFPVVLDSELWGGVQSSLPLGSNSSFLRAVVGGNVAPSQTFGLWPGSRSVAPIDGQLVIGGYDNARMNGSFTNFTIADYNSNQPCPLQVTVADIQFAGQSLFANATETGLSFCIEPSNQRSVLPPALSQAFGNITAQNRTFYRGMTYPTDLRPEGDMVVTLEGGYTTTISNFELFNPQRGSDANGVYAITNDTVVEAGVTDTRNSDPTDVIPTLGGLFLTNNYLLVDYSRKTFGLAPATASNAESIPDIRAICSLNPSSQTLSSPSPGRNIGAIAGGTIGGIAGFLLLALLLWFLFRRHQRRRDKAEVTEIHEAPANRAPSAPSYRSSEKRAEIPSEPQMIDGFVAGRKADGEGGISELGAREVAAQELPAQRGSVRKSGREGMGEEVMQEGDLGGRIEPTYFPRRHYE